MDQHPVPQNISSYEFRLVGDMTLKQFFQLAGGILVAVILYQLPLIGLLKWPLMAVSVLIGVLMAFVPISGRPFSQWLTAFIRAIYTPTQYAWNPTAEPVEKIPDVPAPKTTAPTPLDIIESQLFSRFSQIFSNPTMPLPPTPVIVTPPPPSTPKPQIPTSSVQPPSSTLTIPSPEHPDLLTGLVATSSGSALEGTILELTDSSGVPVRALRSNKLGQFLTATPLNPGDYVLTAEKDGFSFDPVSIHAEGKIISPIIIKAKA